MRGFYILGIYHDDVGELISNVYGDPSFMWFYNGDFYDTELTLRELGCFYAENKGEPSERIANLKELIYYGS